jgi:hypothetical protein
VIRTAVLAAIALGAFAAPALAFESHSAPAPTVSAAFTDTRIFAGMLPQTTSEPFHFGASEPQPLTSDQAAAKRPTVVYELGAGKPSARIDVTDPRDNPFLPQPEPQAGRSSQGAH